MTTTLLARSPATETIVDDVTRRDFLTGLAAAGMLAACGDGGDDGATGDVGADAPRSDRTVQHPLGTTEVPVDVERVVAVTGTVEVDALIDVGVVPVAVAELEIGVGFSEQAEPFLGDAAMLATRREINLEEVAAQRPDLILGTVGWLGDLYDQLSGIAPTVAVDDAVGWRAILGQVAGVLDREVQAEGRIAEVDRQIDELVDRFGDQLNGITYSLVKPLPADGEYGLYLLEDDVEEILGRLGLVRPATQLELFVVAGDTYVGISTEQVEVIDTDVVFLFGYDEPGDREAIAETRADPLFARLPAATSGRVFDVDSAHWYFSSSLATERVLADLEGEILAGLAADR